MAPSHGSHATQLWRDVHSFYLLSPLMGFLSKAWSRLRRPGSPEPWQVQVVAGADEVEAGLQVDASAAVASPQWGRHPQEGANGSEAPEDGEAAWMPPVGLETSHSSPPETWGLSDRNNKENVQKEGSRDPGDEERKSMDGQPAPWSPGLLIRGLRGSDSKCGEEAAEEEGGTELSYPSSHWDGCPAVEDNDDGEAVEEEAPGASTSPVSPQVKPSTWVHCPGEEEDRTTEEEKRTEARETSISPTSSYPKSWECCPGEAPEETEEAKPEPAPAPKQLLRGWECPSNDSEEEEEEEEDTALGAASILLLGASVGAWVCSPGEDTEDEDSELESAEEGEDTEASSLTPPTSAFLKAWVYRPGEDTEEEEEEDNDEDSELESAAEEGEAEASSSKPPTNVFLKTWVYRPGEDTEEEEEEEDQFDDSEAAEGGEAAESSPRSTQIRSWACQPKETEEEKAPEPRPFQVAIYLPGERPPAPWAAPQLPIRLQRRLRLKETPTQEPNDEIPLNTRKVRFSEKVTVHFLVVWAGAAQAARRGPWEQFARDRSRFARRIARAQEELGPCLTPTWRARAWARLGNPLPFLAPIAAPTQILPSSLSSEVPAQATPLPSSPLL
ncbi:protein phosphatase 1 regulatory subunit 15A [Dipodomys spectabilis]|uniref:protein phosphatase 1 regulatory subunit 15A n=1 Tax=Dipodomys spectabilis TaxID=105255 RepID=UPI001C53C861|nr:protein phosphatase 1 regulatory subunit 15A [Dipodomys spectabilis]